MHIVSGGSGMGKSHVRAERYCTMWFRGESLAQQLCRQIKCQDPGSQNSLHRFGLKYGTNIWRCNNRGSSAERDSKRETSVVIHLNTTNIIAQHCMLQHSTARLHSICHNKPQRTTTRCDAIR